MSDHRYIPDHELEQYDSAIERRLRSDIYALRAELKAARGDKEIAILQKETVFSENKRMRKTLQDAPCVCQKQIRFECPVCGGKVVAVKAPGWMNSEQFDSVKAGDFYCESCKDQNTRTGFKYFFDREMPRTIQFACSRCRALNPQPAEPAQESAQAKQ